MFIDRKDAGLKLARALAEYRRTDTVVLAIPRGGVEVGFHVAKQLDLDFSIIVSRKLPFPEDPEAGFGAVSEDGSTFMRADASSWLPEETIRRIVEEQEELESYRLLKFDKRGIHELDPTDFRQHDPLLFSRYSRETWGIC